MYNSLNPYFNMNMNLQKQEVVHVNGKNGALAYQLAPNSSILLLDDTEPIVWLKTTDGGGYATCTPFEIKVHEPEPPVDLKALEERIIKLEGMLNHESNTSTAKSAKQ